ncbi:DUF397 domain-containing protein [Kitasatospora sp. NPDC089509]|uniref:DUF397 domain-containing protein n=1 Tax=Kitasatospora sp. NPDC089509 TaxID=3364079 RepID=UPI00381AF86E
MTRPTFKKSTYSGGDVNCVEVATPGGASCFIRDAKDPTGPILEFDRTAHLAFINAVAAGEFDFGLV